MVYSKLITDREFCLGLLRVNGATATKVLEYLLLNGYWSTTGGISGKELGLDLALTKPAVSRCLKRLLELNLVRYNKVGRVKHWRLNGVLPEGKDWFYGN